MARRPKRRTAAAKAESLGAKQPPATSTVLERPGSKADGLCLLLLAGVCALIYANSLSGDFVYDDHSQIVANRLIRDDALLGKALSSDVWAFKGAREAAWSNYWRPSFVLWLCLNYRLFGLAPWGWHALSLLLHVLATGLAFQLLRRFELDRRVALAIALLFAVHPVHVESVAWISGSTDLLLSCFLLGSLLCVLRALRSHRIWWLPALLLYVGALGSKEVAVLFAPCVAVAAWGACAGSTKERRRRAGWAALTFGALAGAYLVIRGQVLGASELEYAWHGGPWAVLRNAPQLFCFYLRQALLPLWTGPSYGLRPLEDFGLLYGWLALAVTLAASGLALWIARGWVALFGCLLFGCLLGPAFNINAFLPEDIVHDRYLYLPLLGLLIAALVPVARRWGSRRVLLLACLLAVPLGIKTGLDNRTWASDRALWERGVARNPNSAQALAMLGDALLKEGDKAAARTALDRALALRPLTKATIQRAGLLLETGEMAAAVRDLNMVIAAHPQELAAWEYLLKCFEAVGDFAGGVRTARAAREAIPYRYCVLTDKLAVLLYRMGAKQEARQELQAAVPRVETELGEGASAVHFRLGLLELELGASAAGRAHLRRFLQLTQQTRHASIVGLRRQAKAALDEE